MLSLTRALTALLLLSFAVAHPLEERAYDPAASTPRLVRIFTAAINLGPFSQPIPIPGGSRIVAQVTGGQLKGQNKGPSGTIQAGISIIDILNSGQTIVNNVQSFGQQADGTPFLIQESGVGSTADDFARLTLSIGGPQASLANQFLFTEASLSADQKTVSTTGYQVLDR